MGKAKGTTLVGAVKFLRSRRDDAVDVLPAELHHYLGETIYPASWYPEEDLLELIRAVAKLMPGSERETYTLMGQMSARSHGEGVYSHLLEGGASRSGGFALWSSMHDTGRIDTERAGRRDLIVHLVDYGSPSREMCLLTEAYVLETLRMGGAAPKSEKLACQLDGGDRCSWRCTWGERVPEKLLAES